MPGSQFVSCIHLNNEQALDSHEYIRTCRTHAWTCKVFEYCTFFSTSLRTAVLVVQKCDQGASLPRNSAQLFDAVYTIVSECPSLLIARRYSFNKLGEAPRIDHVQQKPWKQQNIEILLRLYLNVYIGGHHAWTMRFFSYIYIYMRTCCSYSCMCIHFDAISQCLIDFHVWLLILFTSSRLHQF